MSSLFDDSWADPNYVFDDSLPLDNSFINPDLQWADIDTSWLNDIGASLDNSFITPLQSIGLDYQTIDPSGVDLSNYTSAEALSNYLGDFKPYSFDYNSGIPGGTFDFRFTDTSKMDPDKMWSTGTPEARAMAEDVREAQQNDEQMSADGLEEVYKFGAGPVGMSMDPSYLLRSKYYNSMPVGTNPYDERDRPAQSYNLDGLAKESNYDYVTGPSGDVYIQGKTFGDYAGYLDEQFKPRFYQDIRNENIAEMMDAAASGRAGGSGGSSGSSGSAKQKYEEAMYKSALQKLQASERAQQSSLGKGLAAAGLALSMAKALGKNPGSGVSKRDSTVEDTGPKYQGARPVKTLYADGGKVELPDNVQGGLLPLALKIAQHLASQGGGKGLVAGHTGGQEDTIDAKLSDGEYVIDAEVVSMLGDGNTEAGAKKLDQMRQNVRKDKRKGGLDSISKPAKKPEQYLKGK